MLNQKKEGDMEAIDEIVELKARVTSVENDMSKLREHMDKKFDAGSLRMDTLSDDIKKLSQHMTDLVVTTSETQKELHTFIAKHDANQMLRDEKLKQIGENTSKLVEFWNAVGQVDPIDYRDNYTFTKMLRQHINKVIGGLFVMGAGGIIWLLQHNGGQ